MVGQGASSYGLILSLDDHIVSAGCLARPALGIGTGYGEDPQLPGLDECDNFVELTIWLLFFEVGIPSGGGAGDSLCFERFDTFGALMVSEAALCFPYHKIFARCAREGDSGDCHCLPHRLFAVGDDRWC